MDVTTKQVDPKVGQTAEGKTYDFLPESAIKTHELQTFEFNSPGQLIITETHEFSAVCPFSGLPDIAKVVIKYYPLSGKAVELKSLKYYLTSFRNVGIYQEGVTKRIKHDMERILETDVEVVTVYNIRGGFLTTCIEGIINYLPNHNSI